MSLPPPTPDMVKKVNSQLSSIMRNIFLVGTPVMARIDKKLIPIVERLVSCGPHHQDQNPKITNLFKWFMHPRRTVEEFSYVLGPLVHYMDSIILGGYMIFVGVAALEVLAVKCPVLEGPWENIMWLIMRLIYSSAMGKTFEPSDRLSAWIVYMIEDADICPNAYLRIELIYLLKMVKLDVTSPRQVLEAMMRAFSNLNNDYLNRNYYNKNYRDCSALRFKSIVNRIKRIESPLPDGLLEFGERLATKLKTVNSSRLSSTMYDITNSHGLNPNNYNEPWELQTLIALLNTTGGYAHDKYDGWYDDVSEDCTMYMCKVLIQKFKPCYLMPQLIYPTASFLINVLEYAIGVLVNPNWDANGEWQMPIDINTSNVIIMDELLHELLTDNGSFTLENSAIWQEVIFRYRRRLKFLKDRFGPFYKYPTIFTLMEHV